MCNVFRFLSPNQCCFKLKTLALVIAWINLVCRIVAIILATVLVYRLYYYPSLYIITLKVLITYFSLSLAANVSLLYGLQKNVPGFILPFLVTHMIENFVLLLVYTGGAILLVLSDLEVYLWAWLPVGLLLLGFFVWLWTCLFLVFNSNEEMTIQRGIRTNRKD